MIYLIQFLCAWVLILLYSQPLANPVQFYIFSVLLLLSIYGMKREMSQTS